MGQDPELGLFLRLAVVLGARRSELIALELREVDLAAGEVLIASGVVRVTGQPLIDKDTKTHAKRRVAVGAETVELLKAHRARQAAAALAAGTTLPPEAYVFARSPDGSTAISPDGVSHRFQGLAAQLGGVLLSPGGQHVRGVAQRARRVSQALDEADRPYLVAAAWLHDIGYAPMLATTAFHPLDGARHVRALGQERLARLVGVRPIDSAPVEGGRLGRPCGPGALSREISENQFGLRRPHISTRGISTLTGLGFSFAAGRDCRYDQRHVRADSKKEINSLAMGSGSSSGAK